jgi:hypothetical protein
MGDFQAGHATMTNMQSNPEGLMGDGRPDPAER